MLDKIGFVIPAHLEDAWTEADKIGRELCNEVQRIYLMIEKGQSGRRSDLQGDRTGLR
jgi:hypothetical protein